MELKCCFYVSIGLSICLAIGLYVTNIVFSFKFKFYEFEKDSIILTVNNHLNTRLIYSFSVNDKCPSGYETLKLGTWNGSFTKPAKNYTVFAGKEICVIRKGDIFKELIDAGKIINKTQDCPGTTKSCGIIDTLNRKLCVDQNEDCPINKDDIDNFPVNLFTSNQKLDNDNKMYLNEEVEEKKIITSIKLSDGFPCIRSNESRWISYHADEYTRSEDCSYVKDKNTDDRYVKFERFRTNKTELYKDNGLDEFINEKTRQDPTIINLYGGPLIGMKLDKRNFNYEELLSIQKLVNSCSRVMKVFSIIMLGVLVGPLIGGGGAASGAGTVCVGIFLGLAGVVIVIGFLVDFILCIIIYCNVQRIEWRIVDFSKICDVYTNEMLKEVVDKYSTNYKFALGIIIVLSLLVFFSISAVVCYRCSS
jgi:hypothetical protein